MTRIGLGCGLVLVVLGTQVSCDGTVFATDNGTKIYTPDWPGVTEFLDEQCVVCHRVDGSWTAATRT